MTTNRQTVLANTHTYHVYNRGVERRQIFTNTREYVHFIETMRYYQYDNPPLRFSKYKQLSQSVQKDFLNALLSQTKIVTIFAYCLMPNHFHLLIRQNTSKGISQFLANISNSYSKYFNTKHSRVGPLLQGTFKATLIETEDQLIHVSRYIHLNPVVSLVTTEEKLEQYPWSSLSEYLGTSTFSFADTSLVQSHFSTVKMYKEFVYDQISYAKTLERIKHLYFEE